jgi:hypothetical protein
VYQPRHEDARTATRGHALSFDVGECQAAAGQDDCPQFSRLVGSRIAVANAELRIPLFGTRELGLFEAPFLPIVPGWQGAD